MFALFALAAASPRGGSEAGSPPLTWLSVPGPPLSVDQISAVPVVYEVTRHGAAPAAAVGGRDDEFVRPPASGRGPMHRPTGPAPENPAVGRSRGAGRLGSALLTLRSVWYELELRVP